MNTNPFIQKTLGFMAIHYAGDFFQESLISIKDHVAKVYIAYSKAPSHGFGTVAVCPDKEYELRKVAEEVLGDKLIWETYHSFHNEAEHRAMRYKHSVGYKFILTIDPDEYFEQIAVALRYADECPHRFFGAIGYIHFWKGFEYCFQDSDAPIRVEKLTADNLLTNNGLPLVVYHTSLYQSEDILRYKQDTFGHKNEIKPGWFTDKFLAWTPEQIDTLTCLHPTRDDIWEKPVKFNGQLPDALKNHKLREKRKMRVLLIPMDYHRHSEGSELFQDMIDGFNVENETQIFTNMMAAVAFKPDVIHFQGSLTPEQLGYLKRETKALVVMWTGDARFVPTQSLILYKDVVDTFFLPFSGKTSKTYHSILGKPCHFIWEPIQNWRYKEPKTLEEGSVIFVGNIYGTLPGGAKRRKLAEFTQKLIPEFEFYGNGSLNGELVYTKVPDAYNSAFLTICENNYDDLDEYFTPRNLGAIAAGSCALMRYFPGIEKHFEHLTHCAYYRNKFELLEWINFFKQNPHNRNVIASNGYKLANENFTMKAWAKQYMQMIKQHFLRS